jgi:ribosomal protein S1
MSRKIFDAVKAMLQKESWQAKVIRVTNGGFIAVVGDEEVFIPQSLAGGIIEEGDILDGLVTEVGTRLPVFSPAKLKRQKALEALKTGKVYEATVTNVTEFGLFVMLDNGVDGLIPSKGLRHWGDHFQPNQTIKVKPAFIDLETGKVSFNLCGV